MVFFFGNLDSGFGWILWILASFFLVYSITRHQLFSWYNFIILIQLILSLFALLSYRNGNYRIGFYLSLIVSIIAVYQLYYLWKQGRKLIWIILPFIIWNFYLLYQNWKDINNSI